MLEQTAGQGELLRKQNGEKLQLERELNKTEQEAFNLTLTDLEKSRNTEMKMLMDSLADKMQG